MNDIISVKMTKAEIRKKLNEHGLYDLPYMWDIALWLVFNTYGDELELVGYGDNLQFHRVEK